jgi:hypothetical protein
MNMNELKLRFGRLTVLKIGEPYLTKSGGRIERWICNCDCGKQILVRKYPILDGRTRSCGCLRRETTSFHRKYADPKQAQINATLRTYVKNAKDRDIDWELTDDQAVTLFLAPCFYCGDLQSNECKAPKRVRSGGSFRYNGIDRLDSSVGYTIENCVPCCKIHNSMKGKMNKDSFVQECKKVVQYLYNREGEVPDLARRHKRKEESYVVTSK